MPGVALMADTTLPSEERTIELEVAEKAQPSPEIVTLTLTTSDGAELPAWAAGAHIDVLLPGGMTRQYSLCGSTDDRATYRIGILRDPVSRGGSTYLHDTVAVGDRVTVRGPRNHFALEPASCYVFVAGGIGVTPLLPMAAAALRGGAEAEFVYCARDRRAMAFLDELQQLLGDRLIVNADDESGLFDLAAYFQKPRNDTLVYACGPGAFLDATTSATAGWPAGSVRFERFEALEFDESGDVGFEVELSRSGRVLNVPADRSILSVLTDAGVRVLSSCTEGTCGTCEVAVLGGDPIEHRDAVLSPEEQETGEMMMVCVSRCRGGRLRLDL